MPKATVQDLDKVVMGELTAYAGLLPESFIEAQKAAAKVAIREIKANPARIGSGKYVREFKTKQEKTRLGGKTTIYNGSRPGLPHLLEYGHAIVAGGRRVGQAKAFPHLKAAEEKAMDVYEKELEKRLENGS